MNKKRIKKQKNPRFYWQNKLFVGTGFFKLCAILATWLLVGVLQKYMKNEFIIHLEQNSPWAHIELEFDMLGIAMKLVN